MRRLNYWRIAAWTYVLINLAGAAYGIVNAEPMHALTHIALLLAGVAGYGVWRFSRRTDLPQKPALQSADDILDHLQESVDGIALEVERIGEAQRFNAKILAERAEKQG